MSEKDLVVPRMVRRAPLEDLDMTILGPADFDRYRKENYQSISEYDQDISLEPKLGPRASEPAKSILIPGVIN